MVPSHGHAVRSPVVGALEQLEHEHDQRMFPVNRLVAAVDHEWRGAVLVQDEDGSVAVHLSSAVVTANDEIGGVESVEVGT